MNGHMDRRTYLATTGAVVGSGFAGCLGGSEDGDENGDDESTQMGMLSTAVSDDPADIGDFERLVVTVDEVWVHPKGSEDDGDEEDEETDADGDGGGNQSDGRDDGMDNETDDESDTGGNESDSDADGNESEGEEPDDDVIRIDAGGAEADLVQLQGDAQKVISSEEVDVGTYSQIKLWVNDEVDAVLTDGSEADVMTPGNAPLKFNKEFEVRANTETTFTADFAPHKRGPNGYVLRPVATEVRVEYNEIDDEGDDTSGDNESGDSGTDNESSE